MQSHCLILGNSYRYVFIALGVPSLLVGPVYNGLAVENLKLLIHRMLSVEIKVTNQIASSSAAAERAI